MQNQARGQRSGDRIDDQLRASGWVVQGMAEPNPAAARGVAVREYPTDTGPMDYLLMVDGEPVGLIKAKREDNRTYAFSHQNVVRDYPQEQSVVDGVNVDHCVWCIDTRLTRAGGKIEAEETVEHRDRLHHLVREQRWLGLDEVLEHAGTQFDASTVSPSRTRAVIHAFANALPRVCSDRQLLAGEANLPPGTFHV